MVFRADDPPADVLTSALAIQRAYIRFISDLNPNSEDGTPWQNYKDAANLLKFDANTTYVQTDDYRAAGIDWVLNNLPAWKK